MFAHVNYKIYLCVINLNLILNKMSIFKILIPKDKAQEVTELESFTVRWEIEGDMYIIHT